MKYASKTKLLISTSLDSSEAIMFKQGGMHKISINPDLFNGVDEIEISFQIEREQMGRHDFIIKESAKAHDALHEEEYKGEGLKFFVGFNE
jgi:hypothetical protein